MVQQRSNVVLRMYDAACTEDGEYSLKKIHLAFSLRRRTKLNSEDRSHGLPVLTHLVLAFNRVGAPVCYWLVSHIPGSDMNYVVFMRENRMRVSGTATST